jgi:uncharacterized protein (TIGR02646 family)
VIQLAEGTLPANAQKWLERWQRDLDGMADYLSQAGAVQELWQQRTTTKTLRKAREVLAGMCGGLERCCYCEENHAHQIEHFYPKSLYPRYAFVWDNFLFSCSECNTEKHDAFAIFPTGSDTRTDVIRSGVAPLDGDPTLINLRTEDPLRFLLLDLRDTFEYLPYPGLTPRDRERAEYTIHILRLNDRDRLVKLREDSFIEYHDLLSKYRDLQRKNAPEGEREKRKGAIRRHPFRGVWEEMKRWHRQFPKGLPDGVGELFRECPEALEW